MTFRSRKIRQERSPAVQAGFREATAVGKKIGALLKSKTPAAKVPSTPEEGADTGAKTSRRIHNLQCTLIVLFAVLCIGFIANIALEGIFGLRIMSIQTVMDTVGTPPAVDAYGHTNILLLGVGDKNHDGVDLTDTVMVVSLDASNTKSVAMFSIPRDLWLKDIDHIPDGRINTLYRDTKSYMKRSDVANLTDDQISKKAMLAVATEISKRLGVEIHGVVKADFTGFVQAVDAIGGVDVDVPKDIIDLEYPGKVVDTYDTFRISKGPQHLDGETALKYARSRHTTSDFGRSARQQQLLSAIGAKIRSQGLLKSPGTILSLLKIAGEHVVMTFDAKELIGLANVAMHLDLTHPFTVQLSDNSQQVGGFLYPPPRELFNGASVLLPEDGRRGWTEIQGLALLAINERRFVTPHRIIVENAGAKAGLARSLGFELIRFGFNVEDIRNRPKGPDGKKISLPHSTVETSDDDAIGLYLATLLKLPGSPLPADESSSAAADDSSSSRTPVTGSGAAVSSAPPLPLTRIILGEDYEFTPFSTLLQPQS